MKAFPFLLPTVEECSLRVAWTGVDASDGSYLPNSRGGNCLDWGRNLPVSNPGMPGALGQPGTTVHFVPIWGFSQTKTTQIGRTKYLVAVRFAYLVICLAVSRIDACTKMGRQMRHP